MSTQQAELTIAGLRLSPEAFPFMPGAGAINGAGEENFIKDFESFVRAPGAVAMIGSITVEPRPGNESLYGGPVFINFPETGFTYNSMGLPNIGIDRLVELIPDMKLLAEANDKELAVSLAPVTKDPAEEWSLMTDVLLEKGVKIIEFNAGCPNVFDENGNPKAVLSHMPDLMAEALHEVAKNVGDDFVAGIKVSPAPAKNFGPNYHLDAKADNLLFNQSLVINGLPFKNKYVSLFNTFGGQMPIDVDGNERPLSVPGGMGGVSGRAIKSILREQMLHFLWELDTEIDVVAAGGIDSGRDIKDRLVIDESIKLASAVTPLWREKNIGAGALRLAEEYVNSLLDD